MKISKARLKTIILEELQEAKGVLSNDETVNKIMGLVDQYKNDERYARYASRIPILKDAISKLLSLEDEGTFKMLLKTDYANLADMFLQTPLDVNSKERTKYHIGDLLYFNFVNAKEVLEDLKIRLEETPQNPTTQMENKQMKITKARLKTIILEELTRVMREQEFGVELELPLTLDAAVRLGWIDEGELEMPGADGIGVNEFDSGLEAAQDALTELGLKSYERKGDSEIYKLSNDGDKSFVEEAFREGLSSGTPYR